MRAVGITSFGGPEALTVVDVPVPEPAAGQVRIKVAAAAVANFDLVARAGWLGPMLPAAPLYVFGWDASGTVDAVGPGVVGFAPGDPVVAVSDWLDTKVGTQAEYVVLDAAALAAAPSTVDLTEAAALPVNAHTATRALDLLGLEAGQTLAITGAGGAVGGFTLELARERGLKVVGLASARDEEFVTSRDAVYVPRSDDPVGALRAVAPEGVDAMVDAAAIGPQMVGTVKDGGAFASLTPPKTPEPERGIEVHRVHMHSDGAELSRLAALVDRGRLTLRVHQTVPFEQAAQAHEMLAKGGIRGRLVLIP
ncbi:NADP-dependent oxidoreductase [Streptomyces iranensis]|uniref:Alcohol dehydrogenase zinc-binding domainprotein n=1 Tax=Streptomyces iranensis TaxID=576784 RepID=A0A060ZJZ7_9ACTN|nr:NADP-dependent oxidoreductase [Streptomyces iranensis]MBP2060862.1 NADPH:quinone reductase-like Zn-dependent oxidoreductase [Streptomyces iranensis]CDR06323.1 alcohol dehydrogenase zinc-binding domainprotein [Streptomyces iranensis]